jgi:Schlafen, AlbA_2
MSTYELPIERIDAALLDSLVRDGVEERRRLEYKRALPGGTDDEKKEFLADTSSFANAAGGDLIYGVSAKRDEQGVATGEPDALIGLPEKNLDAECLRLQDILNAGIRPRLVGVVLQIVRREPEPPCLLVTSAARGSGRATIRAPLTMSAHCGTVRHRPWREPLQNHYTTTENRAVRPGGG